MTPEEFLRIEAQRKAHLNGAVPPPPATLSMPPPAVWGGWGQRKPRVDLPRWMRGLGFPFVPPKPPPQVEEKTPPLPAREFRRDEDGRVG